MKSGWEAIEKWVKMEFDNYLSQKNNAISIFQQNNISIPNMLYDSIKIEDIETINEIIQNEPSFLKIKISPGSNYEFLLNNILHLSDSIKILAWNNRIINYYNLSSFRDIELHAIRFTSFISGYGSFCSQNGINFTAYASTIVELEKAYLTYLESKPIFGII